MGISCKTIHGKALLKITTVKMFFQCNGNGTPIKQNWRITTKNAGTYDANGIEQMVFYIWPWRAFGSLVLFYCIN